MRLLRLRSEYGSEEVVDDFFSEVKPARTYKSPYIQILSVRAMGKRQASEGIMVKD